jgi:hypothetical protein
MYLVAMDFMVNPLFLPLRDFVFTFPFPRFVERQRFSFLTSSKAPTSLNADLGEKFRKEEWLISAILIEISQLSDCSFRLNGSPTKDAFVEEPAFRPVSRPRGLDPLTR